MRRLIAVAVVLVILVAALMWLLRPSPGDPQLASTPHTTTAPTEANTTLAASPLEMDTVGRFSNARASAIEIEKPVPAPTTPRSRTFGRVVDARGTPVPDAEVHIYSRQGAWSRSEALEPDKPSDRSTERLVSRTDTQGKFTFLTPVPTSRLVRIDVRPPPLLRLTQVECGDGFGDRQTLSAGDNDVGDILVEDGGAITGRVVDEAGVGIAGASLIVKMLEGVEHQAVPTESDADGIFTIPNLAPGARKITVWASGRRSVDEVAATLAVGEMKQIEPIVLARAGTIAGFVVDTAGAPADGVYVRARSTRGNKLSSSLPSGPQGAFTVTLDVDEPHTLSIGRSEEWAGLADPDSERIEYEPGRNDVRLVVRPTKRVTFRVTSAADGSPIERFGLALPRRLRPGQMTTQDDVEIEAHPGGALVRAADPATQTLVVDAPGYAPVETDIVLDAGSTDTQTVALAPEGLIVGRVTIGDAPAAGARVTSSRESWRAHNGMLTMRPGANESNSRTDIGPYAGRPRNETAGANGEFRINRLATGTYALTVDTSDGAPGFVREIGVVAGRATDVGLIEVDAGGTLRGRFIPPPGVSPLGYGVAISPVGVDHSRPNPIRSRQIKIAQLDGTFEFKGLAAATWCVQWTVPDANGYLFSDNNEFPRVVVTPGGVAEIVLDASNSSPCKVAVRVFRRGEPFAGALVNAWAQMRGSSKTWSTVKIGVTDAEGRVEGDVEGGLTFRLQIYEKERGPLLLETPEELVAEPNGRIEREIRLDTGSLVLVLPANLTPPEKGSVSVVLSGANTTARQFDVRTAGMGPIGRDGFEWKGTVIPLGPVATGKYSVRVNIRQFDADPAQIGRLIPSDLRPVFTTDVEVRADAETRIEVK